MKIFQHIFLIFSFLSLFTFQALAAGTLDHFEVELSKESAKVGEWLDITIKAVDKNGEVVVDYAGDVLVFSESDPEAIFPKELSENSYTFTKADEGEAKFENAVSFKNKGKQDIYVYDLGDDSLLWVAEVEISEDSTPASLDIAILSPENGVTIGTNNVTISGTSQKNHQIKITLNGTQEFMTTSNSEGVFEKAIEGLKDGENIFQAIVLDADNKSIWESEKVSLKISSNAPEYKSIKIDPKGEMAGETPISVEVIASQGLSDVKVSINDVITALDEEKSGIYKGKIYAPTASGSYGIDVILKDEFGHETKKEDVEQVIVKALELNAAPDGTTIEELSVAVETELKLDITGIKVTELKDRSIVTWDPVKDATSYNVYKKIDATKMELLENVKDPRFEIQITGEEIKYDYFAIKALGATASGEVVQGNLSDMTKVKTGPGLYLLLALLAFALAGSGMYLRKKA